MSVRRTGQALRWAAIAAVLIFIASSLSAESVKYTVSKDRVNLRVEPPRDLPASTTRTSPVVPWRAVQHRVNDPAVFHANLRVGTIERRETTAAMSPGATYQLGIGRGEIVRIRVEEPPIIVVTFRDIGLDERLQSGYKLEFLVENIDKHICEVWLKPLSVDRLHFLVDILSQCFTHDWINHRRFLVEQWA